MKLDVLHGDVLTILPTLPECSFDACLTDPPYGLSFMGKPWDHGVPGAPVWAEVLRVLKPGASVFAFGGTRTFHRLACALEDAGLEIRDTLMWIYGQGFPKSLDISKAIDRQAGAKRTQSIGIRPAADSKIITAPATDAAKAWDGYGTALKPAYEPIIWAMKPCAGTFAQNALEHGVAGINVDVGRIGGEPWQAHDASGLAKTKFFSDGATPVIHKEPHALGRWPANVLLDEDAAAMLDAQSGVTTSGAMRHEVGAYDGDSSTGLLRGRSGPSNQRADTGGASRFFYIPKADADERHLKAFQSKRITHPTMKPIDLCTYLAKLLLPPDGRERRILVPFSGSGSEIIGALRAGWDDALGIELDADYVELSKERILGDAPLFI